MNLTVRSLFLTAAMSVAAMSFAGGLGVGKAAPPLKVAKWVKGTPVTDLHDGKIHVVEFWATWCGPCKMSIPHLTELAKKYKGKADFTGVSVWENGTNTLPGVVKFVSDMGDKMAYNVAADGSDHFMADTWMKAANQDGIPTAFVIGRDGNIQWIGHPMGDLDKVVGQVIAGTFNAKEEQDKEAKAMEAQQKMQEAMAPLNRAWMAKDYKTFSIEVDKVLKTNPELTPNLASAKFQAMALSGDPGAYDYATSLADGIYKGNSPALNNLAWIIIGDDYKLPNPNYAVGVKIAQLAVDAAQSKDPMSMDTLAYGLFKTGEKAKALALQTKAVALAIKTNVDAATLKDMKGRLAKFQASK